MEGQRQYYRGYRSEKKMMRNRRDLGHDQSTDNAIVDVVDKLKKSQLVNGGYCQQGNGSNSYETVEIYMKRTSQIPRHEHACKYQQMESVNKVRLEDHEQEMLFVSRMMFHEKLKSETWLNELPDKKEFMLKILQEMKSLGVQNIYDEESFIRIVLEKKSEIVGKSNSHGSNQSLVILKDKVGHHGNQQNSVDVSEYAAASSGVINSVNQLSDRESSFVKEMMSCEETKDFSIREDSMSEIVRKMKMQGIKDVCNKESFIRFVSENKSKLQGISDQSLSITNFSNGHGSFNEVVACGEFSNSEVSLVKKMMSSEKINWVRELSSYKDKEAFLYSIIREMKMEGIKNICDEEYFIKRIHQEIKRIQEEEKNKHMERMNGVGYQIVRQEIITKYDNNGYRRMSGYRGSGGHGGAGKMINGDGGDFYEDDFRGQGMQQKKIMAGQQKYHHGGGGGYAHGRYYQ